MSLWGWFASLSSTPFNPAKCKTNLKLCNVRLKNFEKKLEAQLKERERAIAAMLRDGKVERAEIGAEYALAVASDIRAISIIAIYCELLLARFPLIVQTEGKVPPEEEAVESVIYAAEHYGDKLPELRAVKQQFVNRYGEEYVAHVFERAQGTASPVEGPDGVPVPPRPTKVNPRLLNELRTHSTLPDRREVETQVAKIATKFDLSYEPGYYASPQPLVPSALEGPGAGLDPAWSWAHDVASPALQPSAPQPYVAQPPAHQPPAPQPPAHQPAVAQPPAHQPSVAQPPAHQPAVAQPPAHQPAVAQPPAHQPAVAAVAQPPAHQPAVAQPLAQPPVAQPVPVAQPSGPPLGGVAVSCGPPPVVTDVPAVGEELTPGGDADFDALMARVAGVRSQPIGDEFSGGKKQQAEVEEEEGGDGDDDDLSALMARVAGLRGNDASEEVVEEPGDAGDDFDALMARVAGLRGQQPEPARTPPPPPATSTAPARHDVTGDLSDLASLTNAARQDASRAVNTADFDQDVSALLQEAQNARDLLEETEPLRQEIEAAEAQRRAEEQALAAEEARQTDDDSADEAGASGHARLPHGMSQEEALQREAASALAARERQERDFAMERDVLDAELRRTQEELSAAREREAAVEASVRASEEEGRKEAGLCKICFEKPFNMVFIQCGHTGICELCAESRTWSNCPFCRAPVSGIVKSYTP